MKLNGRLNFIESNLDKLEPLTSFFTMVEVAVSLRREFHLSRKTTIELIRLFKRKYHIRIIENVSISGETLHWILKSSMEISDALQLNIARNEGALMVTNDKKFITEAKKLHLDVMMFEEFVNFVSSI